MEGTSEDQITVLLTGMGGLVGAALSRRLLEKGHKIYRLVRPGRTADNTNPSVVNLPWNISAGQCDLSSLNQLNKPLDAVIHLAGENIGGRWNADLRQKIHDSRVMGTELLSRSLARLVYKPNVLVSASAVGIYGDCGDELLTESSGVGEGFLAEVCREWEAATAGAEAVGIRTLHARLGVVLSDRGGALARMLTIFRLGLGGRIGNGLQWWSWISIDDAVSAMLHLVRGRLSGPVNVVSPSPVTNSQFTEIFCEVLRRPGILPVPALAVRLAVGEMADALLLSSARVSPTRLLASGFTFEYPELEHALRRLLKE